MKKLLLLLFLLIPQLALGTLYTNDADLVAYWDMESDGADLCDDKSTATANHDLTNTGATRVQNSPPDAQGEYNSSHLATSDQYCTGTAIDLSGTDFTIAFWLYPDDLAGGAHEFHSNQDTSLTVDGIYLQCATDGSIIGYIYAASANCTITTGSGVLVDTTWTHIVLVYDAAAGNDTFWYKNGNSTPVTSIDCDHGQGVAENEIRIGSGTGTADGDMWDGDMDGVAIFKRALSTAEITELYTNGISAPAAGGRRIFVISWLKDEYRKWKRLHRYGHDHAYWKNLFNRFVSATVGR